MPEIEQRGKQLPRARLAPGAASRGDAEDALRHARARRNAWLLGGLAVFFYVGYMAWMFFQSNGG